LADFFQSDSEECKEENGQELEEEKGEDEKRTS